MKPIYKIIIVVVLILGSFLGYNWYMGKTAPSDLDSQKTTEGEAIAYFAGGCFWCVESDYEKLPEVKDVISGYMGGEVDSPSYKEVSAGGTGHRESIKVIYDPTKTTYKDLVIHLLKHIDPTDAGGSFGDRGEQYTSAIYYQNAEEKEIALETIKEIDESKLFDKPIVTSVEPAGDFWLAEDYHQDYSEKNPLRYKYYRSGSGRDDFIEKTLGKEGSDSFPTSTNPWKNFVLPDDKVLKETLSPVQYDVTQKEGTEIPFENEYWDNHQKGIYVDLLSGEPLFSSTDKFDSGTGWPSFLKPIDMTFVTEKKDFKLIIPRTEIRSKYADSHLGHIILDGPEENDKIRYCMNSASLHFVPVENMESEGYGDYLNLFK